MVELKGRLAGSGSVEGSLQFDSEVLIVFHAFEWEAGEFWGSFRGLLNSLHTPFTLQVLETS